jgi:hypothetical protein
MGLLQKFWANWVWVPLSFTGSARRHGLRLSWQSLLSRVCAGPRKTPSPPERRLGSVRSQSDPADLLTLSIGKPTFDQAAGIGMNGRSAGVQRSRQAADRPCCLTGCCAVVRTHGVTPLRQCPLDSTAEGGHAQPPVHLVDCFEGAWPTS